MTKDFAVPFERRRRWISLQYFILRDQALRTYRHTSEAMIRKHYAASILDFTDEITRKTLPTLTDEAARREQRRQADKR